MWGGALVAAGALIATLIHQPDRESTAGRGTESVARRAPAGPAGPTRAVDAAPIPSAPETEFALALAETRKRFEETTNYAEFIRASLANPKFGGKFYAERAFERCSALALINVPNIGGNRSGITAEVPPARVAALNKERDRCRDVATHYPDVLTFRRLLADARLPDDGALSTDRMPIRADARTQDKRLGDLAQAVRYRDPYLIVDLGKAVLHGGATRFEGEKLSEATSGDLGIAWDLVLCDLGADCGQDLLVLAACFGKERICNADTPEHIYRLVLGRESFERIQRYRARIVKALGEGNFEVFR